MKILHFFFDYECPYCYATYKDVLDVIEDYPELEINWSLCEAHPRPEEHPPHTDLAIQGYFFAKDLGIQPQIYHSRMFEAVHDDKIDVEDPAALADYVKDLIDPDRFLEVLEHKIYLTPQETANVTAYEENDVWFVPAFRVDHMGKLDAQGGVGVSREDLIEYLDEIHSSENA